MKRPWIWSWVVLCLMGGCLTQSERTRVRYYSLNNIETSVPRAARQWPATLGIRPLTAASRYRDRIFYRLSEVEVGFYPFDRWVEPPEEMVNQLLTELIESSGLFEQVVAAEDVQASAWILSGEVTRFDEVRKPEGRFAACWLRLELRQARTEELLWSEMLTAKVALSDNTPEALAQAMSKAVYDVAVQLISRLGSAKLAFSR